MTFDLILEHWQTHKVKFVTVEECVDMDDSRSSSCMFRVNSYMSANRATPMIDPFDWESHIDDRHGRTQTRLSSSASLARSKPMTTHEIRAEDLTWAEMYFGDIDEARDHLKLIVEELKEIEGDPLQLQNRKELQERADELEDLIMRSMFDLL